jgi:hypothetical protein
MDVIAGKCHCQQFNPDDASTSSQQTSAQVDKLVELWNVHEAAAAAEANSTRISLSASTSEVEETSSNNSLFRPISQEVLSQVQPVGFGMSFLPFARRAFTQQRRAHGQLVADLLLEAFAGAIVGCLYLQLEFLNVTK